jgi:hypothetical protein
MKTSIYLCTIAISILCFSCKIKTEEVFITPEISIQLPSDYSRVDKTHSLGLISYEARRNKAKFLTAVVPVDGLDTLDLDQKTEWLKKNIQGYINGFNGQQISIEKPKSEGLLINEFSFEYSRNDSLFISYSQMMLSDKEMIIIMYETVKPETDQAIKERNVFFKSLEIE